MCLKSGVSKSRKAGHRMVKECYKDVARVRDLVRTLPHSGVLVALMSAIMRQRPCGGGNGQVSSLAIDRLATA